MRIGKRRHASGNGRWSVPSADGSRYGCENAHGTILGDGGGRCDAQRAAMTFFEKEVRPILVKRCFECHSNTKQKGGLRVDHIGYLKSGGDTGPALVPGKPEKSALIEAVRYANEDFQMPPKNNGGKLPDAEIAIWSGGSRWALRGRRMPRRRSW
jgi:hypothetical protein